MKKVLIFYTSVGLGHKYIAENIGWQLGQAGLEVRLEDISKVQDGKFARALIGVHWFINRYLPFIWSWLYKSWLVNFLISPLRLPLAARNSGRVKKLILAYQPDMVITTQTTASSAVAYLKKRGVYTRPFGIAFSDFHLHRFWLYDQADFYLANILEQKKEMLRLGILPEKIYVCGMALQPQPEVNMAAIKEKLGIAAGEKVVLVGSGSLGTGLNEELIRKVSSLQKVKVLVVCGKNKGYKERLMQKLTQANVKIFGFYSPMSELYAIADIYVGKPGGLTTAEALSWNLPLLVTHWLPGQEELNVEYLKNRHLVILADDAVAQVKQEIDTGEFKKQLATNPAVARLIRPEFSAQMAVLQVLHSLTNRG
ncbi:MAG: hypothetical protein M1400_00975 [Patescibacteria group bacterium]|nr:hypothetical protein [Patescibacteria group bacterium]